MKMNEMSCSDRCCFDPPNSTGLAQDIELWPNY